YRSAIFFENPDQQMRAQKSKDELDRSGKFRKPIVTQIVPAAPFYPAEDYHQQYLAKRGMGACHI
ncbi:MAG: peptide-methionine (S)-S-oxide reductase, partial [Chloroflexota bacterium]